MASFVASFLLAAAATSVLRGSGSDEGATSGTVEVDEQAFPDVGPWRVTVAATRAGRTSSVTVLRGPKAANAAPSNETENARPNDEAAGELQAELERLRGGDTAARRAALERYLDTGGIEAGNSKDPSPDDTRTAVASASLLGGLIAECPPGSGITPATVAAIKDVSRAADFPGTLPHVTLAANADGETVVSQVAIRGGGARRVAVTIVARAPMTPTSIMEGPEVLEELAKWVADYVHAPGKDAQAC